MRMAAIGSHLCEHHQVSILIGGHEPEFSRIAPEINRVYLPPIVARGGGPLDYIEREQCRDCYAAEDGRDVRLAFQERRVIMEATVRDFRPDVLLTEYFPLGRSLFGDELLPVIRAVHDLGGVACCSVREILQGDISTAANSNRAVDRRRYFDFHERSVAMLNENYDRLLVHGDPSLISLDMTVPSWILEMIRVPVTYTGYVSEELPDRSGCPDEIQDLLDGGGFVVTSVGAGGSAGRTGFTHGGEAIDAAIAAWKLLAASGRSGGRTMVIFAGAHGRHEEIRRIREACGDGPFLVRPAAPDFLCWLQAADLSISRAGYNTCTNILAVGVPAVLLPSRSNLDQDPRARIFAERGMVATLFEHELTPDRLATAMERGLSSCREKPGVNLDGAGVTASLIQSIAGQS
jgi:predicted glycosyltransferase